MKKLTSLLLSLMLVLSLCSFAAAEEEPTLVRFWHNMSSGAKQEALQASVDQFNETIGKEKNIFVEATYIGGYAEMYTKCQMASQTDEVPTVAVAGNTYVVGMIEDGLLADMAGFAAATGFDTDNLLDCFMQIEGNLDGQLYSLPYIRSTCVLYYNKTIADELGIAEPDTMDDLLEFGRKMTLKDENGDVLRWGFQIRRGFGYTNAGWLAQMGEPILDTDGSSPALEGTALLEHWTWWQNAVKEGICRPYDSTNGDTIAAEMLVQGKLGAFTASSGSLKNLLKNMKEAGYELGVAYMPRVNAEVENRTAAVGGGQLVLMAAGNDEKTQAAGWEFLQFMLTDEQVYNTAVATGYLPVTKSVASYDKMIAFWEENPTYKTAFEQMMNWGICQEYPSIPELQEYMENLQEIGDYLIQEQSITPEEAIEQIRANTAHIFNK